jgi:hypothetical protein
LILKVTSLLEEHIKKNKKIKNMSITSRITRDREQYLTNRHMASLTDMERSSTLLQNPNFILSLIITYSSFYLALLVS